MDKSKIFEFVKKEYEKGIEDSVIRLILAAKDFHADDIEEVIKVASEQKNLPVEKQINPFIIPVAPKKILWGKVVMIVIIQLAVIYISESTPSKECLSEVNTFNFCTIYSFLPLFIFILPILIWIINFFFRGKRTYSLVVATIISIIIASIVYLV